MSLIYLYSHDGEGLGHFRRNLNIAHAATRHVRSLSALLLTGSHGAAMFSLPGRCDFVKLPTLIKTADGIYASPLGACRNTDAASMRAALLRTIVSQHPPDILVVDKHPAGLGGELLPALRWLRKHSAGTTIILGLRDILDTPEQVEREWRRDGVQAVLRRFYDRVWVYGDDTVFPMAEAYAFAPELARKAHACGYVMASAPPAPSRRPGERTVVATVGGGRDGHPVLEAALAAVVQARRRQPKLALRMYAGPLMPDSDYAALRRAVAPHRAFVTLERFSDRMLRYLAAADAVVTMGGYNSLLECVSMGKCAIVVPRESPRCEQLIRARAFEKRGLVRLVRGQDLASGALESALDAVLEGAWRPASASTVNLSGYKRILSDIRSALGARRPQ